VMQRHALVMHATRARASITALRDDAFDELVPLDRPVDVLHATDISEWWTAAAAIDAVHGLRISFLFMVSSVPPHHAHFSDELRYRIPHTMQWRYR
jgi:hypothetical protein